MNVPRAMVMPLECVLAVLLSVVLASVSRAGPDAAPGEGDIFRLHPPASPEATTREAPMPFTQMVPFRRGGLAPEDVGLVAVNGQPLEATARVLNYWPDGSVRMVLVEGVVLPALFSADAIPAAFIDAIPAAAARRNPVRCIDVADDRLMLYGDDDSVLATLSLEAAWSPITKEKIIYPNDKDLNDAVAQYGWAHPLADLDERARPRPLRPRVRERTVEADHPIFTDYVVRGDCGPAAPGDALQWQLHLRLYHATPVVRWQMTWVLHWDPGTHALSRAAWVLRPAGGIQSAAIPEAGGAGLPLRIAGADAFVRFGPNGKGVVEGAQAGAIHVERPDDRWHRVTARSGGLTIGLAACDLSRLGPSHLRVGETALEAASWSERSGLGMDLRSSVKPDEFGIGDGDLTSDGRGAAFSLDGALVLSTSEADVEALTAAEAARNYLWFPSSLDLYESGALQDRVHPETVGAGDPLASRLRATQESAYFLVRSRDYWRWYGALNYGDVRTNFKAIRDMPALGLYHDRWGLHGRYGWRNGSSDVHGRMLYFGLLVEDRDLILAALDYARHVADVDVKHASFFAEPQGGEGGMHRRNKDHWSGGVEPQYTTSRGLYFAYWTTGNQRIGQVLDEVRAFCRNIDRQASSAFRAEAWIHRYAETLDRDDLGVARRLLDACAAQWRRQADVPEDLDGLSAIYFDNFRRVGDGLLVLVDFHHNTGDAEYLEAILKSVCRHGVGSYDDSYLVAYLMANGVAAEQIGEELVDAARRRAPRQADDRPAEIPKTQWTYEWLRERTTSNRQSYNIGRAMRYIPQTVEMFGTRGQD